MKLLKRMLPKEGGQVLPMALMLMLLGAMVIIPTLNFATTNLKSTQEVDQHTRELYAADAGIDNALWYLQSEERAKIINPTLNWNPPREYWLYDDQPVEKVKVNNKEVKVNIGTAWLLGGFLNPPLSEPLPGDYYNANNYWTVIGAINIDVQPRKNYIVDIITTASADTTLDHIGVWLPQGYEYDGNVKINNVAINGTGDPLHLVKNPGAAQPLRGGNVYKWDYLGKTFKELSDVAPPPPPGSQTPNKKYPTTVRLSFDYKVTPFKEARGFFPWIQLFSGKIAWDSDAGFYHVQSTSFTPPSDNTTVEAYVPKGVVRYVSGSSGASSAIKGDYIAIGNSLMTCCWNSTCNGSPTGPSPTCTCTCGTTTCCGNNPYRNYTPAPQVFTPSTTYPDAERESYATVNSSGAGAVPSDAKIERAYLYWTAWLRGDKVWLESPALPGHGSWQWTSCMGVDSNGNDKWGPCSLLTNPTVQSVKAWLPANAYDGKAYLAVSVNGVDTKVAPINAGDPAGTVVANTWYISQGSSDVQPSYQYSCFADVTDQVKAVTNVLPGTKFTVAGVHAHPAVIHPGKICDTNDPSITWSRSPNAGWSMIIIYSSQQPEVQVHQVYLYTGCDHLFNNSIPKEFIITGFAAPDLPGENNEAKMTVFASEGDVNYVSPSNPTNPTEYLGFKGQQSPDYAQLYGVSGTAGVYTWDVFNSISSIGGFTPSIISTCQTGVGIISGIDIDTYTTTNPSGGQLLSDIVKRGDISANIKAQSLGDGFEIIYVVFSVRSTAIPAGTEFNVGSMMYRIQ